MKSLSHTVAVTGAAGFLGARIVDGLIRTGKTVRCADIVKIDRPDAVTFQGSMSDQDAMSRFLTGAHTLIHLAWIGNAANPPEGFAQNADKNLMASLRLLETARNAGVKRFVFASSGGTVYGPSRAERLSETDACLPISAYGAGKAAFELFAHAFCHANDMSLVSLRVSNLYGPGQRGDRNQGLVAATIWKALKNERIEIWGDGSVVRDYVYIADVAEAFVKATDYPGSTVVLNIGSGIGRSVRDVIRTIEKVLGRKIEVNWKPARTVDVPCNVLDTTRAAEVLGWRATTDFLGGVRNAVAWSGNLLGPPTNTKATMHRVPDHSSCQ